MKTPGKVEYHRLVESKTLSIREEIYIEAARAIGASRPRILFQHILPNCLSPITVKVSMDMGMAILAAASLGFIGLGAQPPFPEWGAMISIGRNYLPTWWWYSTFSGVFMAWLLAFGERVRTRCPLIPPRRRKLESFTPLASFPRLRVWRPYVESYGQAPEVGDMGAVQ